MSSRSSFVYFYHHRSKHHLNQYARSAGFLDWANQPEPFREWIGSPRFQLEMPRSREENDRTYPSVLFQPSPVMPLKLSSISSLFYYSLSLSSWKSSHGSSWNLRCNPSSGNLHPVEAYLILPPRDTTSAAGQQESILVDSARVYHYSSLRHDLEMRAEYSRDHWQQSQLGHLLGAGQMLVALTAIHWRESWKYGERAFRYSQLDLGHAICAIKLAAMAQGWKVFVQPRVADESLASLIGIDRRKDFESCLDIEETEYPEVALLIDTGSGNNCPDAIAAILRTAVSAWNPQGARWHGMANALSQEHQQYDIIHMTAEATKNVVQSQYPHDVDVNWIQRTATGQPYAIGLQTEESSLHQLIRQRRSALDFDGTTYISKEDFYSMLLNLIPSQVPLLWNTLYSAALPNPRIHLLLFVHRVEGISPGLYALIRDEKELDRIRNEWMHSSIRYEWATPEGCPQNLPLFLLHQGDYRRVAKTMSCIQDIAADSCFSLGMISDFARTVDSMGSHAYKLLFQEAGYVGHILYIHSEHLGIRATGIGCFFDDPVNSLVQETPAEMVNDASVELFLRSNRHRHMHWQSLYHLAAGGPIEDTRIRTTDPYVELAKKQK